MLPCYVLLDLETTGANPVTDRITEIAALRVENGVEVARWSSLVNPGVPISGFIQRLTGISNAMVAQAPPFSDVAAGLLALLDNAVLVAHNVRFDHGFLQHELGRLELALQVRTLCTVRLSRLLYPQFRSHGLDALMQRHGLTSPARHRAMGDVLVLQQWLQQAQGELGPAQVQHHARQLLLGRKARAPKSAAPAQAPTQKHVPSPGSLMPTHDTFMQQALALAAQSLLLTSPNPRVGCVITTADGQLLGQGHTQRAGQAHAEIMALRDAAARGHDVRGATAYVTLEPCSHQGRTGPCCDALIAAGIKTVVAAITDANPRVAGQGFERLRAAGVQVQIGPGGAESRELNLGFFSRMVRQTPWVRMKLAASLDGKTALDNGVSQWITSAAARADGHAWRARACAVLTGIGTVLADNPRLDVRLVETPRQPALVVVDSRLQTPLDAQLFMPGRALLIYTASQDPARHAALQARGATVVPLPDAQGQVDLAAMLRDLARREINELHVEAGEKLNGALIRAGLVDEFVVYLAPKLIGQGRGMAQFGPLQDLTQALPLTFQSSTLVGPDLRIVARVSGRDNF